MANVEMVKLQLAMAFGQGAGTMLAEADALEGLLATNGHILTRALPTWEKSHWAFTELVRVLGQVAAARAASERHGRIRLTHIEYAMPAASDLCPCVEMNPERRNPPNHP
jgi:hypothetical protein